MSPQFQIIIAVATICVSLLALTVSIVALWKTSYSKFKPIFTTGMLGFRIYPIKNGEEKWFIPSIDLAISVTNGGARPGRVLKARLVSRFPKLPIPDHWEYFEPVWEVDAVLFRKMGNKDRFNWINKVALGNWMPFIVLPKETITKHFLFESRWEKPVIQDEVIFRLEILTDSSKKWILVNQWQFHLSTSCWAELANVGSSFTIPDIGAMELGETMIHPEDLHKYTGTDESIPSQGFNIEASYLNYPDQEQ